MRLPAAAPARLWRRCLTPLLVALALLPAAAHGQAALEVTPARIDVASIEQPEAVTARLRLRAPADASLSSIRLTTFSNDGITVGLAAGESAELATLARGDEHLWSLVLRPTRPLAKTAKVVFAVAMTEHPKAEAGTAQGEAQGENAAPRQRHLFATLEIEPAPADPLANVVSLEIKASAATASRQRPATLYVLLRNKKDFALEITELTWQAPPFIALREAGADCGDAAAAPAAAPAEPRSLGAYQQLVLPFLVCPGEQIVPGKYIVLAAARVAVDGSERAVLGASHEVEIGVLGESEFLNLLGVPSLLLLPGFLLLITWRMLHSMLTASGEAGFRLKPREADFWAVAIALSLCFAFAYPWLTEMLLPEGRRDYLVAYGLQDLVYVYAAAIALGLLCFLGGRFIAFIGAKIAAARLARSQPLTGDTPLAALRKLARVDGTGDLPACHLASAAAAQELLELAPWSQGDSLWLAPPILVKIKDRFADPDESLRANNALQRLTTGADVDAATLLELAQEGETKKWWTLTWGEVGAIKGPVTRDRESVQSLDRSARLVREHP
ncbi:MAG TPA: hypothetical protein VKP12_00165 [Kiloniellaceae bacterium]|nr:hypothetical protein [Kiloniellaceae bacterium]